MEVLDTAVAALAALDGVAPVYARDGVVYDADSGKPYTDADIEALALPRQRADAERQVDRAAEAARGRWLTPGTGQAMAYREKEVEARALKVAIAAGQTPDEAAYPHLSAEVGVTADTLSAVADVVMTKASEWAAMSAQIEGTRLAAKAAVAAAADAPALQAILDGLTWPG